MAAVCRFVDENQVRLRRAGCPLQQVPASSDESACGGCPHNAAWPQEPSIGCRVSIPGAVWRAALTQLGERDPKLLADVHALRGRDLKDADHDVVNNVLARWIGLEGVNDAGLETARTARSFVRAAERTGTGIRLWE